MNSQTKVMSFETTRQWLTGARRQGQRVVCTNRYFEILHSGHVTYLEGARSLGDLLLVGLNSDSSVRALKGPDRPGQWGAGSGAGPGGAGMRGCGLHFCRKKSGPFPGTGLP